MIDVESALIEELEDLKLKLRIAENERIRIRNEIAQKLGIFINDDKIELWHDDPENINGGSITVYYKYKSADMKNLTV